MNEAQTEAYRLKEEQRPENPKPCCADHYMAVNRQQRREADKHCKIRRY